MRYPPAVRGVPTARTYGPLLSLDLPLALVWHTTETGSWPGYRSGRVAPHHSYKATTREWRWHGAPADQRVGTMRSSLWTRTPANEKSYQVEIVAYSNRQIADERPGRIWVGDFTEDHYRDLAAFAAWLAALTGIDMTRVTSTPPGGWRSGSGSPLRLSRDTWLDFDGMTAHGAVTGQSHWDTGVLDLNRISIYADDVAGPPPPPTLELFNMAYADTLDLDDWVSTLRDEDIDQLFALGVHSPATGAAHWKGLLAAHPNAADADAWENFRRTTSARIGFWQPEDTTINQPPTSAPHYQIVGDITPT